MISEILEIIVKGWRTGWDFGGTLEKFLKKPKVRKAKPGEKELVALLHTVKVAFDTSKLASIDSYRLAASVALQGAYDADVPLDNPLIDSMMEIVIKYGEYEGLYGIDFDVKIPESHAGIAELKSQLNHNLRLYENDEEVLHVFAYFLATLFKEIFLTLPKSCLAEEGDQSDGIIFETHILNLIDDVYALVEGICIEFYHEDLKDLKLFEKTRDLLQVNGQLAAGMNPSDPANYGKSFPHPTQCRKMEQDFMVESFFRHIPFKNIFLQKLPFQIPARLRFEHAHILAASGYGKTQLLSNFVIDDLNTRTGFCIIDSQGDLISKLLLIDRLSPSKNPDVSKKLVLVDASDVEYPPCLNLFALNNDLDRLTLKGKEILINSTVDLYTYIFSSLLGAELTARQGTVFVYIARLMMEIPDASIVTLRQLMENGAQFKPYMDRLQGSTKAFFETQFFSREFASTKKQVLYRLWAVLANSSLERMFSSSENKVNLFDAMNEGKIVLINTSKQVLGKIGSEVMGKFFIAMLTQAAIKRASIQENSRVPFHVYIDEAWEYVDPMFDQLINQTRKYKVGFHLFHHNYDQLPASVRASIIASTSIKLAGAVSSKDARVLAEEMKTSTEQILRVKKYDYSHAEYNLFVKNVTASSVLIDVPFGLLEKEPVMNARDYELLIETNRGSYCRHISEVVFGEASKPEVVEKAETEAQVLTLEERQRIEKTEVFLESLGDDEKAIKQPDTPSSPERGGAKHKYLQALISKLANEKGFVATAEFQVASGDGYIDMVLIREGVRIACEISVKNSVGYEVKNLQKCLNAGYVNIAMVADDPVHLKAIYERANKELSPADFKKVAFVNDELLVGYLAKFDKPKSADHKKKMHGYKVNVNYKKANPEQQKAKQAVVDKILLNTAAD